MTLSRIFYSVLGFIVIFVDSYFLCCCNTSLEPTPPISHNIPQWWMMMMDDSLNSSPNIGLDLTFAHYLMMSTARIMYCAAAAGQRLSTKVRPPGVIMSSLWCVKNAKKSQELLIRSIARQVHEERVKCVRRCLHQQQLSPVTTPQWLYVASGQDDAVLSHSHLNAILVTNLVNNNLILYLGTL